MKKKIIIGSSVAIVLILAIGIFCGMNINQLKVVDDFTIEYGTPISENIRDYVLEDTKEKIIENTTLEVVGLDKQSEYAEVGKYIVKLMHKNTEERVVVTVEDTTKPIFTDENNTIDIFTNETIDYSKLFVAEDLSDVAIEVDDSAVNYAKAGTYTLQVKATDSSDNVATKDVTLNITQTTLALNCSSMSLYKGNSQELQTTIVGRNQTATYTSSDTSVATVDGNGKVVAVGKGNATITVEANGLSVPCEVAVTVASKTTTSSNKNTSNNTSTPSSSSSEEMSDAEWEDFLDSIGASGSPEGDPEDHKGNVGGGLMSGGGGFQP